jgi:hypothetical protein
MSYQNQGVWNQNALYFEGVSFDNCLGHPAPNGEYHHHVNPTCLYDDSDENYHSPIIGYAFDNFPIYGAYAYTNIDGTGGISRMASSYQFKNLSNRVNGPSLSQFPLGAYIEDFEYISGLGNLDEYNGRYCVTLVSGVMGFLFLMQRTVCHIKIKEFGIRMLYILRESLLIIV